MGRVAKTNCISRNKIGILYFKGITMFDKKQYAKQYYENNKQKILERTKLRKKKNPQRELEYAKKYQLTKEGRVVSFLTKAKKRAKEKGWDFDLDIAFLRSIAVDKCPVYGIDLVWINAKKLSDNSPSLDRIDSKKGYTKNNVMFLSFKANRLKSDATSKDLYIMANWIKQQERESENGKSEQA
jgi:hypothetical protein